MFLDRRAAQSALVTLSLQSRIVQCAGSMSWWTYVWYLAWLVISAGVYCLYSIHHVEVPYEAIDSPAQRPVPLPGPCYENLQSVSLVPFAYHALRHSTWTAVTQPDIRAFTLLLRWVLPPCNAAHMSEQAHS